MTLVEFSLIFSLGLVSSMHCVGMCGPIVLSYSLALGRGSNTRMLAAHLAYNAGRILTYSALGAVAGVLGGAVDFAGQLAGIRSVTAIVAGALMILAALFMLDVIPHRLLARFDPLQVVSRFIKPVGGRLSAPTVSSKFTLGVLLGFLPCGLVYAALLRAVATGTPVAGALTMLAFGLGTTSALFTIGYFSSVFGFRLGRWGSRLAAVSVALLGMFLIWRGVLPMFPVAGQHLAQPHGCH